MTSLDDNTINQVDPIPLYRTLQLAIHILLKCARDISQDGPQIESVHKTSLNKLKRTQVIESMFSHHNKIKLELTRKTSRKSPSTFKPNNIILTNQVKQGMEREIFERNENKNSI